MLTWIGRIGAGFAVLVLIVVLAMMIAPRFLDRVYYRGPVSDHFDGQHFFNPDDRPSVEQRRSGISPFRFLRFAVGMDRAPWPKHVPVAQTIPPARVEGDAMRVTWIGHSTVLVQTQGLNILTDPIWSDRASPLSFLGPKRVRAPGVAFDHLPKIDLVLVSHNHYDHLDIPTLRRLWQRDRPLIVTPLGNDTILKAKGIPSIARDWGQRVAVRPGIDVIVERVHHWGSRFGADRNRALWGGFTVTLPGGNLFFAGDTGWGDGSWPKAAAKDGPYRLALVPIGAYLPREMMQSSHIGPDQAVAIFRMLGAAHALGVHWGTFQLSAEGFEEPAQRLAADAAESGLAPDRFRTTVPGEPWMVPLR
jgi:L-ascorbate metabolism protein UlaG (beta-lactamase superfamily)